MSDESKKDEKLNHREKKVVEALSSGAAKTAQEALLMADYNPSNKNSLRVMAQKVMGRPRVQNALDAAIKARYANHGEIAAETVMELMQDTTQSPMVRLKAVELLAKFLGWNAPTKHASVNVSLKDDLALPEDE